MWYATGVVVERVRNKEACFFAARLSSDKSRPFSLVCLLSRGCSVLFLLCVFLLSVLSCICLSLSVRSCLFVSVVWLCLYCVCGGGGGVCGVCGVCGSDDSKHAVSVQGHADYAPN